MYSFTNMSPIDYELCGVIEAVLQENEPYTLQPTLNFFTVEAKAMNFATMVCAIQKIDRVQISNKYLGSR